MPISLHFATNRHGAGTPDFVFHRGRPGFNINVAYYVKVSLAHMILNGVFERFPKLQVGAVEHEISWVPHFLRSMDFYYTQRPPGEVRFQFTEDAVPSDYFHRNVFLSFQEDGVGVRLRDIIGVDQLLWGSDYPHVGVHLSPEPGGPGGDPGRLLRRREGQDRRRQRRPGLRHRVADWEVRKVPCFTLRLTQTTIGDDQYKIYLSLEEEGKATRRAESDFPFRLTNQEQRDLRWYLEPQIRYLVPAGRLQLATGTHPGHEAIQPHAEQCPSMVGRRSQRVSVYLHPQLGPAFFVQSVNEHGHESSRVIQWQQFVKRRRQQPHLLPVHISKRHIPVSSPNVGSQCTR